MAEAKKRRELLPLIHQHLLQAGYVRAAREVKLQSGQKTFPTQPVTLLDIYTHWERTSEEAKKRKADELDENLQAKKVRVSDPVSSSESSEVEEEYTAKGMKTTRPLLAKSVTLMPEKNLAVTKDRAKGKNKKVTGKAVNSISPPTPNKGPAPLGKPGLATLAQALSPRSNPVSKNQAADSSSSSSDSEAEGAASVDRLHPRPAGPVARKPESSSSGASGDETDIETQVKPGVKAQLTNTPGRMVPASTGPKGGTSAPGTGKPVTASPQAKAGTPVRIAGDGRPEESSESSEESESEEEMPASQGQVKPAVTAPHVTPGSTKKPQGRASTPAARKAVAATTPRAQIGAPGKAVEMRRAEESSESSEESEGEDEVPASQGQVKAAGRTPLVSSVPVSPVSVKGSQEKATAPALRKPVTQPSQAKVGTPNVATKAGVESSESSEESESEEEAPAPEGKVSQARAPAGRGAVTAPASTKGAAATHPQAQAKKVGSRKPEESSESSESSESEEASASKGSVKAAGRTPRALSVPVTPISFTGTHERVSASVATRPQAKAGTPIQASGAGRAEESSESSEESESEEEAPAVQGPVKPAVTASQVSVPLGSAKKPQGRASTPAAGKAMAATSLQAKIVTPTAKAVGAGKPGESSESSEESESEEETPASQGQVKAAGRTPRAVSVPVTPISVTGTHERVSTSVATQLRTKAGTPVQAEKAEKSSESSEESESEEEAPAVRGKGKPVVIASQVGITPGSARKPQGRVSTPAAGNRVAATAPMAKVATPTTKASGGGKPGESSESSEESESEEEAPASQGQVKAAGRTPRAVSVPVTPISISGTHERASASVATRPQAKAGTPIKASGAGRAENSSESSEESESEEEAPAVQGPVKPAVTTSQVSVTRGSAKKPQGRASTPAAGKAMAATSLQAKVVTPTAKAVGAGKPGESSESSEESESEEEAPASQGQVEAAGRTPRAVSVPVTPISVTGTHERVSTSVATQPQAKAGTPIKASGAGRAEKSSESSEESESEEEAPTVRGQVKPTVTASQVSVTPGSIKKFQGKASTPAAGKGVATKSTRAKVVTSTDASGGGKPGESSESSEESESEEETPASQGQVKAAGRTPRAVSVPVTPISVTGTYERVSASVTTQPQAKAGTPIKASGAGRAEKSSESSDESESEEEALAVQGPVKPAVTTSQVGVPLGSAKKPQGRGSTPAAGKAMAATPLQAKVVTPTAKAAGGGKPGESSESSEESESEEETPASQGQVGVTPGSTKKTQGRASTPAAGRAVVTTLPQIKVNKTPLIFVDPKRSLAGKAAAPTKAAVPVSASKEGRVAESEGSSSSGSEEEEEDLIPATQNLDTSTAKPTVVALPIARRGPVPAPRASSPEDSSEESDSEEEKSTQVKPSPALAPLAVATVKTSGQKARTPQPSVKGRKTSGSALAQLPAALKIPALTKAAQDAGGFPGSTPSSILKGSNGKKAKGKAGQPQASPTKAAGATRRAAHINSNNLPGKRQKENGEGVTKAKSAPKKGAAPKEEAGMVPESSEVSSEEEVEPSQSLLSGSPAPRLPGSTPKSTPTVPAKAQPPETLPRGPPKPEVGKTTAANDPLGVIVPASSATDDSSDGGSSEDDGKPTAVKPPVGTGRETSCEKETPVAPRHPVTVPNSAPPVPTSNHKSTPGTNAAYALLSLARAGAESSGDGELDSEEEALATSRAQASVVKVLTDLLQQEKKKATKIIKAAKSPKVKEGKKQKSSQKRKLAGEDGDTKATGNKKQKLATEDSQEGEAKAGKGGRTKKGKKEKGTGDAQEKRVRGASGTKKSKEKSGDDLDPTKVRSEDAGDTKTKKEKKEKKKSDKKDKTPKDKKKRKKSLSKDSDSSVLKKKKKKEKKVDQSK
ncbi:treacle protein isoform X2 [Ornithorhynchus anatinus]|uniref:treacle protein isoform X2 n=1 Tax=Ornithorhynchus anatinus TaxID=9258 RepID=UPI0010A8C647|nr:treacle protein isoform X2 [Ornithorhynchus anatinus]